MKIGDYSINEKYFSREAIVGLQNQHDPDLPYRCTKCEQEVTPWWHDGREVLIDPRTTILSFECVDEVHGDWEMVPITVRLEHVCKKETGLRG